MIDFHIHIIWDGCAPREEGMLPAEALHYAALYGCRGAALILRADGSGLRDLTQLARTVRRLSLYANVEAFTGVELVHVPPALLPDTVREARERGAQLVLAHGETLDEPVAPGTNLAAVEAGVDILAHPGLVDDEVAAYAAEKGVALELSACPRHALTNAHVAAMADKHGCALAPGGNVRTPLEFARHLPWNAVCKGAAMTPAMTGKFHNDARTMVKRLMTPLKNTLS